jgi:hypothetical protein
LGLEKLKEFTIGKGEEGKQVPQITILSRPSETSLIRELWSLTSSSFLFRNKTQSGLISVKQKRVNCLSRGSNVFPDLTTSL